MRTLAALKLSSTRVASLDEPELQRRMGLSHHQGRNTHRFEQFRLGDTASEVLYVHPYNTRPFLECFAGHSGWDPRLGTDAKRQKYIATLADWWMAATRSEASS